jgi:pyrroloquinoline quinone biosynthesis protein B
MKTPLIIIAILIFFGCNNHSSPTIETIISTPELSETFLVVLGTIQDAGSPHIACEKKCCSNLFEKADPLRKVVSLGIIDSQNDKTYLFEATPDITSQAKMLKKLAGSSKELPDGIFITHAHIGHYTGLIYLGKEATNASQVPVYTMPRLKNYLEENGPWSQLVHTQNILLHSLENETKINLTSNLKVTPFIVPHRDEYSETVGYKIEGPNKSVLFIPDIDKWEKWDTSIIEAVSKVDYAFIDATFYDGDEINTRDISQIPHPFIIESMAIFKNLSSQEKKKIHFIHFNHTNPVINPKSKAYKYVLENGFNIAKINSSFSL